MVSAGATAHGGSVHTVALVRLESSSVGIFGQAWHQGRKYFARFLLIGCCALLLNAPVWLLHYAPVAGIGNVVGTTLLSLAYQLLVLTPVTYGGMHAFLRAARGEAPRVRDLFAPFNRAYLPCVLAGLLVGTPAMVAVLLLAIPALVALLYVANVLPNAWLAGGLALLLTVPGVVIAVRTAFVPFLIVDEQLGVVASVKESWRRTGRCSWQILGLGLLSIPINVLGLMLLLVGIIPTSIWTALAFASLFAAVTERQSSAQLD